MQIRVNSVTDESKGKYRRLTVEYNQDGRDKKWNLVSFGPNKDIYDLFKTAKSGDAFEVTVTKDGEYNKWTKAVKLDGDVAATTSTTTTSRSGGTWETPEERAKKQVYIIRQSSVASAIQYAGTRDLSPDKVFELAKRIEKHVLGVDEPDITEPDDEIL